MKGWRVKKCKQCGHPNLILEPDVSVIRYCLFCGHSMLVGKREKDDK